ncbi:drug resistance transporter, EmrB/QacA family [Actinokineospora spheciospongiae]|uniref:Drug resistance transporter, EmrB/QacA family n=1 Tax=Actinokineospora spheciospongiae TaxID=909613 RepID=W7IQ21_9PSEU|nr:MFS transporter [Actinokineospora spheciospongiae]EWC62985.1 drug resistance transporter, EmrB/QacA family [Actinokineospora spheciospongiae]
MSATTTDTAGGDTRPGTGAGALWVLLLASTLTVMAGSIITPVLEVIRGDLGVTGTAAGLIITAHGLAIALSSPVIGWMIDRWGVRVPLGAGLVLYGLAGGLGLVLDSYPALIASRFVFGIGAAAVFSGTTVAMFVLYRQGDERDRVMGLRGTATSLGGVVWPLVGGVLGGLSWHGPFGIYLLGVPLGIATLLLLPRTGGVDATPGRPRKGMFRLVRDYPALLGYYGLQALGAILMYALVVFLPQRLGQLGVERPILVSLYTVVMAATMSLVGVFYARIRRGSTYQRLLVVALSCWAACFVLLAAVSQPIVLLLAPVLLGLGQGIALPALTVLVGEGAPADLRGQATSLSGTTTFLGQFLSPLLLGPLIGATSIPIGFAISAGLAAVALLALLSFPLSVDRVGAPGAGKT